MSVLDWIVLVVLFVLPFIIVIWAYKKRRRLFYNVHFTAAATYMRFQNESKRNAMEFVQYQQEEEEKDDEGEKVINPPTGGK